MLKAIKEMISDGASCFEVLLMVNRELDGHFNFSDPMQVKQYNELAEIKKECENNLVEEFYSAMSKEDFTRSATAVVRSHQEVAQKLADQKYLVEAYSQITVERMDKYSRGCQGLINIQYNKNTPLVLDEVNPDDISKYEKISGRLQHGDSIELRQTSGYTYFIIVGSEPPSVFDPKLIFSALGNIIDTVYSLGLNKVGIILEVPSGNEVRDLWRIYFQIILMQILYKITLYGKSEIKPVFAFLFDEDYNKKRFENLLLVLSAPAEQSKVTRRPELLNRDERLSRIKEKCLTKDPVFSARLSAVLSVIDEADVPVLILGESGVGKSMLAEIIHRESIRGDMPFEEQNCGGLNDDKLDQRLFGWTKGSFTGAGKDTKGKIARAEGGTLFLDEVDRMPQAVRNALLTFIETKRYDIIGSEKSVVADVRLIFGTNKDLKMMSNKGSFEEDFYYRISQRVVEIPPLRERIDDIDIIVPHLITKLNSQRKVYITVEPEALSYLKTYSWPGNVRELVNFVKQRYYDCLSFEQTVITSEMLKLVPFENTPSAKEDDFIELLDILKKLLDNWDYSQGKFIDEVMNPILSKLYMDECFKSLGTTKKKENAMKILGLSGENYSRSTLQLSYNKFSDVKEKLSL